MKWRENETIFFKRDASFVQFQRFNLQQPQLKIQTRKKKLTHLAVSELGVPGYKKENTLHSMLFLIQWYQKIF